MKAFITALKHPGYQKCVFYGVVSLLAFDQMVKYGRGYSSTVITQRFLELFEEFQPGSAEKFVKFILEKGAN